MRERLTALFLCLVLVGTVGATAVATAAPPVKTLAPPHLVSPKNSADIPVETATIFEWKEVSGAVSYLVEFEQASGAKHEWTFAYSATTSDTSVNVGFIYSGSYRWHVIAIASHEVQNSEPSNWRTFTVE